MLRGFGKKLVPFSGSATKNYLSHSNEFHESTDTHVNSEVHRNGSIETHPFSSEGSSKSKDPATARDNSCVNCCLVVCPLLTICCLGNSANKRVITCRS
ncbi:hypothetical protein AAMO2058_000987900 [Amorphochlora amoebiformis]|mmetsp:Transcript_10568/g.16717  ORF Transcript_10568/g.16717 Transcript_10568/m.16717 type:complete len:99 (-) Transcript_10568:232-528(-)